MALKTVICIDTSASTAGNYKYYEKVQGILKSETNKIVIEWNGTARIINSPNFKPMGSTLPQSFLQILKDFKYDYNLIVTTDGAIGDSDVKVCKRVLELTYILTRIKSFKIYFIGNTKEMNLKISALFNKVQNKQIIINDDEPISVFNVRAVQDLKYEHFIDNKAIIATVLALIQEHPKNKEQIRSQLCKAANRIIGELATKSSIQNFYANDDINGCIEFVRQFDNSEKKIFQQSMAKVLDLFKKDNDYSLSHLENTNFCKESKITTTIDYDDDNEISDQDFICDILLTKCSFPCILVKLIKDNKSENEDKFSIIPDKLSKKFSQHPFLILNHDDIIEKIIKRVEHQTIDLYTYNNLDNKFKSPFTREKLKGVFILHNDSADYDLIFRNNNRTLSFIFGKNNKLPGNKVIWNILFLYILSKHHTAWKNHKSQLKDEILYICRNTTSLIALAPILNPTISDKFDACLWYIFNVAPKAFENASSNILRYVEASEKFCDLYSYLYGKDMKELYEKLKIWNIWKYLVRNKSNINNLKLAVFSQIQSHKIINGSTILFSGESQCNDDNNSRCNCKKFDVNPQIVFRLYNILKNNSNPTLYDKVNFDALYKEEPNMEVIFKDDFSEDSLKHISICISTCNPTVICPVTQKHWKECTGSYDVNTESYVRLFKRFCLAKRRYPVNENELLVFYSNRINCNIDGVFVCPLNTKKCLKIVFKKYANVIKTYSVKQYLNISDKNCKEAVRFQTEKRCTKCNFHGCLNYDVEI